MPIKVTYQDEKGNPIEEEKSVSKPITSADKDLWEAMQGEAYQTGVYEDDIINQTPKGLALLTKYGIDPDRAKDYQADLALKTKQQQDNPKDIPQVMHGFSSKELFKNKTPRQRYYSYLLQQGDNPPEDYKTDFDSFLDRMTQLKEKEDAKWVGFGDPKADVNYKGPDKVSDVWQSPTVVNGELVQPAGFYKPENNVPVSVVPDPRFPTRDPITGRVTPVKVPIPVSDQGDEEE